MEVEKSKIGIIGFGNMGSAIAFRFAAQGYNIAVFDEDASKIQALEPIRVVESISELTSSAEMIILAIKPQNFNVMLSELKLNPNLNEKIIISIAAGVTTQLIEEMLSPLKAKVVRTMPNLFAASGNGVSGICKGKYASSEDLVIAQKLFGLLGEAVIVKEDMMDAVTACSGSGPGYLCYLIEEDKPSKRIDHLKKIIPEYEQAAEAIGFSKGEIKYFATTTGNAVIDYLTKHPDDKAPRELREKVTSKGGTTEAAITILKSDGTLSQALQAAKERAKELSENIRESIKEG
jgi:pyrroline-5-carboxylate reductase